MQATTYEGMYATDDDLSEITGMQSYYFRGAIDNNWVYFAEAYWRIIRINGDGSVRLIYSGTIAPEEETCIVMENDSIYIDGSNYNNDYATGEYVGWMYTIGEQHGHEVSSNIKNILDNWFENFFSNESNYLNYINNNQILCNDRTAYTDSDGLTISNGFGSSNSQFFGARIRHSNNQPCLICPNNDDAFTTYNAFIGNNYLNYPVGLITQDEVIMAGLNDFNNTSNYLYVNPSLSYWTASPNLYYQNYATGYVVPYSIDVELVRTFGIRPVISLKGDTIVTGDGTWDVPYVVQ